MTRGTAQTPGFLKLFAPILFFEGYLLITILLFRYGPWEYANKSSNEVLFFALLYQFSLLIGYLVAHALYRAPVSHAVDARKLLTASIVLNLLIFLPTSFARTGLFIPDVIGGLQNPGLAYSNSLIYRSTGAGAFVEYIRIAMGFVIYACVPLAVFFWRYLSGTVRILSGVVILSNILLFVSMGTNRAIAEYAVLIPLLLITGAIAGTFKMTFKRILGVTLVFAVLASSFSSFFSATMESREGSYIESGYFPPGNTRVDKANTLLKLTPPSLETAVTGLSGYLSQGYFAMGLALREPFVPLYGLGSAPFVLRQYQLLTGTEDAYYQTYPARIEKYGWLQDRYWSSIYVWLASDLSFWGIPLFCFLLGSILYTTWRDTIEFRHPWAVLLLSLNMLMLFYFSSNNQIGQSGETLASYIFIFFMWFTSRYGVRFVLSRRET